MTIKCSSGIHLGDDTPAVASVSLMVWPTDLPKVLRSPADAKMMPLKGVHLCEQCQQRLIAKDPAVLHQYVPTIAKLREMFKNDQSLDYNEFKWAFLTLPSEEDQQT